VSDASAAADHDAALEAVLTSARAVALAAGQLPGGQVRALNLGLERLRGLGTALASFTALVRLDAASNRLTSLSGRATAVTAPFGVKHL
jgi:hypothetical protein